MNDYMAAIRKNLVVVLALLAVGLLGGLGAASVAKKSYTSTSQLMFAMEGANNVSDINSAAAYTMAQMPTYEALATTPLVLGPVAQDPRIGLTTEQLMEHVKSAQLPQSTMLTITAKGDSPEQAQAISQGVADQMVKATSDSGKSAVRMAPKVAAPADLPAAPSAPNKAIYVLAGGLLGLMLGVVLAVVRAGMSQRAADLRLARSEVK